MFQRTMVMLWKGTEFIFLGIVKLESKLWTLCIRSKRFLLCYVCVCVYPLCSLPLVILLIAKTKRSKTLSQIWTYLYKNILFTDISKHGHSSSAVSVSPRACHASLHLTVFLVFPFSVRQQSSQIYVKLGFSTINRHLFLCTLQVFYYRLG